jgi:hypothetical protein
VNYGKKIIATDYGGPVDYLNQSHQKIPYHIVNEWAYPDLGKAAESMEFLFWVD